MYLLLLIQVLTAGFQQIYFCFVFSFRVMRVYSTHTKKKAFSISKMSSGPLADGEVSIHFTLNDT